MIKQKCWVIEAVVKKKFKVVFEDDVLREEAIDMFESEEYDDIIDESDILEIVEIVDAE